MFQYEGSKNFNISSIKNVSHHCLHECFTEGLSIQQRSCRGHMKLRSATRTLKRKIEAGYGVTVSSEESEAERKMKNLMIYHCSKI
jgi:hypothetical protein